MIVRQYGLTNNSITLQRMLQSLSTTNTFSDYIPLYQLNTYTTYITIIERTIQENIAL